MEEMKLKPFDKVLVRNGNKGAWTPDIFRFYDDYELERPFICIGGNYSQCIAYENNEEFTCTDDNYIPNVEFEEDLPIDTPVMCKGIYDEGEHWDLGYWAGNNSVYKGTKKSKDTIYTLTYKYIIPVDKFDFNNPENSLKYNIVKNK